MKNPMLVLLKKSLGYLCVKSSAYKLQWLSCCIVGLLLISSHSCFAQSKLSSSANAGSANAQALTKFLSQKSTEDQPDLFATHNCFIENKGQYGKPPARLSDMGKVLYGYEGFDMPVLFTERGVIFLQKKVEAMPEKEREKLEKQGKESDEEKEETHYITMRFINAASDGQVMAVDENSSYFTYGMLEQKARGFRKIVYKNIYPGVDISFYFNRRDKPGFEYSIRLQPGADLSQVKMAFGGDLKTLQQQGDGMMQVKSEFGSFEHSMPVGFYEDEPSKKISCAFRRVKNTVSFIAKEAYDNKRAIVIDPFVSSTSNLTGLNAGKAKDIDFDYAGNIYVTGGGDGGSNHMLAKYDANGNLQWTFSGILTNPSWQFGTYFGGWVVEKTTGSIYLGQGFEYINGFRVIRLNSAGLYDNYITTANPNFREDWKMYWNCNNGSPQILIAGGGTNSNINFGVCTPPSTTITSLNITGIPYSGTSGWAQDISDLVIDPLTNDLFTIYGSLYGTPSLSNKIFKNKAPYNSGSIAWNLYSGFTSIQEIANRPYLAGSQIDNSSNVFAVNSSYLFYWDGKNLKAFDKATGNTVGTPLTIATNSTLMSGGIIADECNNVFVGSTNGTIKVYKFNGSIFNDAPAPDISIPGYSTKSVYDLAYNESQKLLYASGDGFVAAFDVSSYGCPATTYTLNINANCGTGTATVTVSPTPPSGSTITYVLYQGNSQLASNSTGVFTGLSPGITYTVKVYINQVCSGTLTVKDFVLPGPALGLTKTDATCGNATGSITATGSAGTSPYSYSKDGAVFQSNGTFSNLSAGLYIITVKDAGGCKTPDSIVVKNSNGPGISFTKTDVLCGSNNGTITATGSGGTAPLQYSINGSTYQSSTLFAGLKPGEYILTVKDARGCTNATSVTINSLNGPQLSVTPAATTCNNSNGSITALGSGGTAPLQYSINGNIFQSGSQFTNLSAGNYTVYVKDANGCVATTNTTITNSAGPSVTATTTAASCNNVNGTITANGSGGTAPLQYSINGTFFQTNNIYTGLAAGTYTITVKDANGCTNTTTVTVNNTTAPTISAVAGNASCGGNNGSITLTATGTGSFQYSINGFTYQSGNIFSGLPAGNYVAYVKDVSGCIGATTITIKNTAAPQVTATATATSCTVNDGKITATATGGTAPLQYSIDGVNYQGSNLFTGLAEGNYTVIVKDANGCTSSVQTSITNSSGLTVTASAISTTCTGNNGSVTAIAKGGTAPLVYSKDGINFQSSNIFSNLAPGNYTITAKDANGCSITTTAKVGSVSSASITATKTDANCNNNNGMIDASASGGTSPYTFSIDGTNFQTIGTFINLSPATYTVTVKDAIGCTNNTSITIVNNGTGPGPTLVIKNIDSSYCGNNEGSIRVDGSGGTTPYVFSKDGVNFQGGGTFNNLPPGDYTITVKDANGCTSSKIVTILDVPAPTISVTTTATACGTNNGSIIATGSGGTKPYRFNINGGTYQSSGTFSGLSAGTYSIGIKDGEQCTNSITVTVANTGGPTVTAVKQDGSCGNKNGTITATGTGGSGSLTYNLNGGTYQSSGIFSGLAAGTYEVGVKDATGCTGITTVLINNPGMPATTLKAIDATCNSSNGSITANTSGGSSPIKYSIDGTIFQSANVFSNLAPGNYTITVLDAAGCFNQSNISITKTALPEVSAFSIPSLCTSNNGAITATGTKGTTPYVFSIDGSVFQSSPSFNNLGAGFYTLTIKDASGCTNTTGITVSSLSGPQLAASSTPATCGKNNGLITATGTGGANPLMFSVDGINFQAGNNFPSVAQGIYIISVKDANGCINTKPVTVGNIAGPQQLTAKLTDATCGTNNGSVILTVSGGTTPYQYSLNGSVFQPSNAFNGIAAGNYNLTVKDNNNCPITKTVTIANLNGPLTTATALDAGCSVANGAITINATGGTSPLSYSINGTTYQSFNIFTGLSGGNYNVSARDANNCSNSVNITVKTANGPSVTATTISAACSQHNGSITATASGGQSPYQYSIDGTIFQVSNVFSNLGGGNYTLTVKDANGCTKSITTTVSSTSGPTLSASATAATCSLKNGTISAISFGGTAPFSYSLDGINYQSSNIFNNLAGGNYTVFIKDGSGCTNSTTVTVSATGAPNITANSTTATCNSSNGKITVNATGGLSPYAYSIDGINYQAGNIFSGLASGSYTVTVRDSKNCSSTAIVIVNTTTGATISATSTDATCSLNNGTITAIATGGTSPLSYSIDAITYQQSNIFTSLGGGSYSVNVKDAKGCISTTSVTVKSTIAPNVSAITTDATCNSSNGTITATGSSGLSPYDYSLDGITYLPANVFTGLPGGSYIVFVQDANNCKSSISVAVNDIGAPGITATSTTATCSASNGSISALVSGGTAPFLYSIDGTSYQQSSTFGSLAAGTYTLSVKDANNCTSSISITVSATSILTLSANTITATCNGSNGSITMNSSGGTPPYSYSIDGVNFQSNNVFNSLSAGIYNITVQDANNCKSSIVVTVNNTSAPVVTASTVSARCDGNNGAIVASAFGGVIPFTFSIDGVNFSSSNVFSGLPGGNYQLTVKDANGCISSTAVTVKNTSTPAVTASATNETCNDGNGTITASASGGKSPYVYSLDGITFQATNNFTGLSGGNYIVSVKDANNCVNSTAVTIVNTSSPAITTVASPATCNTDNGTITATATKGTAPFYYSIDGTTFQSNNIYSGLAPGNYTITIKDANGCKGSANVVVKNAATPTIAVATTVASCGLDNGSVIATATGGTAPIMYSIDGANFQASNTFGNLAGGNYTITIKDANSCLNSTNTIVNATAAPALSASATAATCNSANGTINVTATGGTAPLQYSIDGINFQSSKIFNSIPGGTYTITVRDANSCASSTNITVNTSGAPALTAVTANATCNAPNGTITANATGGTTPLSYSIDGINYQPGNIFNKVAGGTYTLSVKDVNGCINSISINIGSTAPPSITANTTAATCNTANGTISLTVSGGSSPVNFSLDGINYQTGNTFTNLSSGSYTVYAKDVVGCTSTAAATVDAASAPAITAAANAASCNGHNGSVTATASGGTGPLTYSLDETNYQPGNSFAGLSAGLYTIYVKDANGCINSTTVDITSTSAPAVTATVSAANCNAANGSITASVSGGTAPFVYSIDGTNFQSTATFINLASGTYTVMVKDANGCTSSVSASINSSSAPTISLATTTASCGNNNGTIDALAFGGTPPYSFSVDGNLYSQNNTFKNVAAGTYTVFVKDANGCVNSTQTTINGTTGPALSAIVTPASCNAANGAITAEASGTDAPFSYSIDGINFGSDSVFNLLKPGVYTITTKDANGCQAVASAVVTTVNTVAIDAGNDITLCEGSTATLNATSDATSFSWSPADGLSNPLSLTPTVAPIITTTYLLTVLKNGCTATDSVTVTVNPAPIPFAGNDTAVCKGNNLQLHAINGNSYTWSPVTFLSNPNIANPVVINLPGNFSYHLSVTDEKGCHSLRSDTINITVLPPAKIFAGNDTAIAMGQPVQLNAIDVNQVGFTRFTWSPAYRLSDPYIANPLSTTDKEITYQVTASNRLNCQSTDQITIRVYRGPDIYVPTAFTPNGDGLNDIEKAIPVGIKEFKFFNIYNRFGQLVFTTANPSKGWDGIYQGVKQAPGTYVWQTEGVGYDGKVVYKKGTVVLIR